jgi:hypothetical protein
MVSGADIGSAEKCSGGAVLRTQPPRAAEWAGSEAEMHAPFAGGRLSTGLRTRACRSRVVAFVPDRDALKAGETARVHIIAMIDFLFFNAEISKNWGNRGNHPSVSMRTVKWALTALGLLCLPVAPAGAAAYVLGDSLGLGISQAAKIKNLSKLSVHIRGPKAVQQFTHIPSGSTVFLSLGTNDAHGSIARLDKSIDAIVRVAERKKVKVFWMGPPCIRKTWDARARELDAILHAKLANTPVRYVSMRDELMCSGELHAGDGVHLKMKGYAHMWEKARLAAGYAVADASPSPVVPALPRPALRAKKIERIPLPIPRRPRP